VVAGVKRRVRSVPGEMGARVKSNCIDFLVLSIQQEPDVAAMATTRFMHRSRDHTCSNAFLGCFIALNAASGKGLRAVYRFTVYGLYT